MIHADLAGDECGCGMPADAFASWRLPPDDAHRLGSVLYRSLCVDCASRYLSGDNPPTRMVEHQAAVENRKRELAARRRREREAMQRAQETMGTDWGRRG